MDSSLNKSGILQEKLHLFYNNKKNLMKFLNVINKKTDYSLRIIEWFVSNYSKKYNIVYKIDKKDFNVFLSYKDQLKSYKKKQFDPFKRYEKFTLSIHEHSIVTTIGQLNFFKWAISNNILNYVENNLKIIKNDMNVNLVHQTNSSKNSEVTEPLVKRKKRQSLSSCATRTTVKRYTKVILTFD